MANIVRKFELIDQRTYYLPSDNNHTVTHLATVRWGMREFVYFRLEDGRTFIEEVVLKPSYINNKMVAKYKLVEDNELWLGLANFLEEQGLTQMRPPPTLGG